MGFTKGSTNCGKFSDEQRYRLLGNAWDLNMFTWVFRLSVSQVPRICCLHPHICPSISTDWTPQQISDVKCRMCLQTDGELSIPIVALPIECAGGPVRALPIVCRTIALHTGIALPLLPSTSRSFLPIARASDQPNCRRTVAAQPAPLCSLLPSTSRSFGTQSRTDCD